MSMTITNQTSSDYWFGPLHLPAGVGQTLVVDDTSETSLYLLNDAVADAINNLYNSGKITVSGQASPFPRATGVPQLLHGDGVPEGMVYAPQGSLYMRRDSTNPASSLYTKTTGTTIDTGWQAMAAGVAWTKLADTGFISAAQASFDFSSIDQSHDALKLVMELRSDAASGIVSAVLKLNADGTSSYYTQRVGGAGNTASAAGGATIGGPPDITGSGCIPTAGAYNAGDFAYVVVDVPFYRSAHYKNVFASTWAFANSANSFLETNAVQWTNTAAITELTVTPGSGNWAAGCRAILYGI